MAFDGEGVLVGPRDAARLGDVVGLGPHRHVLERAPQPVVEHRVANLLIAEFPALPGPGNQKRRTAHVLHAAGHDDLRVAGANRLVGQHHGLQSRAAHLVDRQRRDVSGKSGKQRRLPRGAWPKPAASTLPMITSSTASAGKPGAADRLGHGHRAQRGAGTLDNHPTACRSECDSRR